MTEIKKAKCCGTCKHFKEVAEYCWVHKFGIVDGTKDLDCCCVCDEHEWGEEE